jgi:hypothetical protein
VGSEESSDVETRPSRWSRAGKWLASPLLITVVAAVLSGLLLPYIARGWQNHQKALEVKTGLVTQMSESSSGTVATSRFLAARLIPTTAEAQPVWNKAYRDWATESSSIGAKLQAYVSLDTGNRWQSFGYAVTDFLSLSVRASSLEARKAQIDELRSLLPKPLRFSPEDRAALLTPRASPPFQEAYRKVSLSLARWRDQLVREVLSAHMAGF